jgi:hypothetical protein
MTMNANAQSVIQETPSIRKLALTTAIALVVAAIILMTVVLPAEYGLDPLGTGEALGLSPLAGVINPILPEDEAPVERAKLTPTQQGPVGHYVAPYKTDTTSFVLGPYEYVEYKYRLEKDATMVYSWAADGGLLHDFHGDRDGAPANASESFDKEARRQASGTFTAPFSGIHGWFWENPSGETVTVSLASAGFYASAIEIRLDKSRHPRELMPVKVQ